MSVHCVVPLRESDPILRAASELARYLGKGLDRPVTVRSEAPQQAGSIRLGLFADLPAAAGDSLGSGGPSDDAYAIRVGGDGGVIAGANPRSVLLGVYRYLTELGFRWVRPGTDGELVPRLCEPLPEVSVQEAASYRHRGVCIEGAVSRENVLDMVDWMPKLGFNAYFIQFREAFNFYQRWYEHAGNPTLPAEPFDLARARELTAELRQQIKERGLDLHMVGHGWTCEPFGIPGTGWFQHEGPLPEATVSLLAEINGKRALWGGVALNTNLCYGNPETRRIVTDAIVDWAKQNRDVDIIHFWLADGSNNQCECSLCADTEPADFYVQMLNEVDSKMSRESLDARIVFLIYVDLLWPPRRERLHHPDRFLLMFAPITRSYSEAFAPPEDSGTPELPPYQRNRLKFPREPGLNVAFLRAWQELFDGDSFDFDYHFMWDHHKDPGQYAMAAVLHDDCVRLRDLRLNGLVSCQNQRVFFPTGLGMTVMGRTLWNRDLPFDEIVDDYFEAAFGPGGPEVKAYLADLSRLFDPVLLRGERDERARAEAPAKLRQAQQRIEQMRATIRKGCREGANPCHAASWRYLEAHADFAVLFAHALEARYGGDAETAAARGRKLFQWIRENEVRLQPVFDPFEFQMTIGRLLGVPRNEILQARKA